MHGEPAGKDDSHSRKSESHVTSSLSLLSIQPRRERPSTYPSVAVSGVLKPHLAAKHSVHHDEIQQGQAHTKPPPNQSDTQGVRTGQRFFDGYISGGVVTRRQQARV